MEHIHSLFLGHLFGTVCLTILEIRSPLLLILLTLWCPLLPYGYSYEASCARPG